MKTWLSSFCIIIICTVSLLPQKAASNNNYENIINQIKILQVVSEGSIPAGGISIVKDAATFQLTSGQVYRFSNVSGKEVFLFFKGTGQFIFDAPSTIEKEQLERFYNKKILNEEIKSLFFVFSDTTTLNYFDEVKFEQTTSNKLLEDIVYPMSYLMDTEAGYFDSEFMYSFLDNRTTPLFYAHIEFKDFETLFYKISPGQFEEISLSRKKSNSTRWSRATDLICSFHANNSFSNTLARKQTLDIIDIPFYRINLNINNDQEVSGECELKFDLNQPHSRWLKLSLYYELIADSVFLNGNTQSFYQGKENPEIWIKLPDSINANSINSLKIFYHGELLKKDEFGWIAIKSSLNWYPKYNSFENSLFEITFTYPSNYDLVSIGERISYSENEETKTACWKSQLPTRNVSFNIGKFEKYEFEKKEIPKVNVFISPAAHSKLAHMLVEYEILSGADMEEKIGTDIQASLEFYQKVFGKIPLKEVNVTEIPYLHGEAFPGLIHLSWFNYQGTEIDKSGELMRAHEVAHQWWGIGVDFEDYHNQWLSEGFAEFSALYFIQAGFSNDDYFDILDKFKTDILSNRKYLIGEGQKSGPIWLGYRTNSSETEGDFSVIVYEKGAWVLHMLRNMMLDLKTMNEDKFAGLLKEFFISYYGKKATIQDFKKLADKYSGENLDWFFNQFIYGTEIPEYVFSYNTNQKADGKFYTTCKVIQNNVSDNFKMYVPIKIVLSGNRFARLRLEIKGKETTIELPGLPEKPEEIIFNDLNSVLCEVDND